MSKTREEAAFPPVFFPTQKVGSLSLSVSTKASEGGRERETKNWTDVLAVSPFPSSYALSNVLMKCAYISSSLCRRRWKQREEKEEGSSLKALQYSNEKGRKEERKTESVHFRKRERGLD